MEISPARRRKTPRPPPSARQQTVQLQPSFTIISHTRGIPIHYTLLPIPCGSLRSAPVWYAAEYLTPSPHVHFSAHVQAEYYTIFTLPKPISTHHLCEKLFSPARPEEGRRRGRPGWRPRRSVSPSTRRSSRCPPD